MTTGQRIGELAKQKNINLHQLAILAEISYNTLYSIVRRRSDRIDIDTVRKIALALDVHPIEIYGDRALELIDYGTDLWQRAYEHHDLIAKYGPPENLTEPQPIQNFQLAGFDMQENRIFNKLAIDFQTLNLGGMSEAARSVEIIAGNPIFQRTAAPESPQGMENTDTPQKEETPPESP